MLLVNVDGARSVSVCAAVLAQMCSGLAGPTGLASHLHQKRCSTSQPLQHQLPPDVCVIRRKGPGKEAGRREWPRKRKTLTLTY